MASLFDQIKSKTAQGVSKAISSTDKTLKKVDINHNISRLQEELRRAHEEFGRNAHREATVAQESLDVFLNRCRLLEESIGQFQEKLKQIDQGGTDEAPTDQSTETCAQCGAENSMDSKFCASCGARLHPEA